VWRLPCGAALRNWQRLRSFIDTSSHLLLVSAAERDGEDCRPSQCCQNEAPTCKLQRLLSQP
jgi:hypothetical protein